MLALLLLMKSWRNRLMLRGLKLNGLIRRWSMHPTLYMPCMFEARLPWVLPLMTSHYLIGRRTTGLLRYGLLLNNKCTLTQLNFLDSLFLMLLLSYTIKTLILNVNSRVCIQPWFFSKTFTMKISILQQMYASVCMLCMICMILILELIILILDLLWSKIMLVAWSERTTCFINSF